MKINLTDGQLKDFNKIIFVDSERREYLGKMMNEHKLSCPECDTRQVQLIGYMDIIPAQWRCRHCKHKFEWEPE